MGKSLIPYLKYIVLAAIIYMPIFGHLNTLPIRIYDEARLAINAYEMLNNNNFIVTHYDGNPDMWNTKPPLMIWFQVISMKLIGVSELSVRLPSVIATLLTCITLLVFSQRYLNSFWLGFIAILTLITSQGYIEIHSSRTGDYDALLTLFTTLSGLYFFMFCETQRNKYLYFFFITITLAVLTKSISGLLFVPALFLYSLYQKQTIQILKNKHFYIGLLCFVFFISGYYLLREAYNPGYIEAVQKNELGGRYLEVIEEHKHSFWYYYNNFIDTQLTAWYLLIPCGLAVGLSAKDNKLNRITVFSALMISTFFLIISAAQTKLEWYNVPLYPFLSLVIAVFIYYIFESLKNATWIGNKLNLNVIPFLFLFLIFIGPFQKIINKTYKPKEYPWDTALYEISYYLKDAVKGKYNLNGQYLLYDGYNAHIIFYLNVLNDKGARIELKDWGTMQKDDIGIAYQNKVKQYIEQHYIFDIINTNGNIITYKIHGRKE